MNKLEQLINEFCPEGVECKTLGELGVFYSGISGKSKDDFSNGNAKFITYMNVFSNLSLKIDVDDKVKIGENENQNTIQYGDILFTGSSETPEECGMSSVLTSITDEKLYLNSFCFGFRFYDEKLMLPEFSKYVFRSSEIRKQIKRTASGVTRFNVSKKKMEKVTIPLPPIMVQEEIVRILDKFTELTAEFTAELTAELTARKQQYEYYSESLLNFTEEYDCKKIKLKEICDIYLGLTATPKYTNSGVKFISAQNTSKDFLDLENVKYISEIDYAKATSNAKPKRGDILFTRVGSNLGHPVIIDTDEKLCIFVSLGFLRIKNKNIVSNSYLKHWMNTDLFWSQVRKKVFGAAKVNLNTGWLKEFELTLPPIDIQEKIVNHLDCFEKYFNFLHDNLSLEIETRQKQYEYYRDKLLTFKKKEAAENE